MWRGSVSSASVVSGSTRPTGQTSAPTRAQAAAKHRLPSVARELVLSWTMSSAADRAVDELADRPEGGGEPASRSAEKQTPVGRPVVPVVVVRRAVGAARRTKASGWSRSAAFGVGGRRAISS